METRKLTESAVLTALFIVISMFFVSTVIAYSLFLDIGVPIFIALIYMRCDSKYTLMASIISVIIITFIFGNPAVGIYMIQGIFIGFICGFLILKNNKLYDDIFYASIFSSVIIIFVDVFFSGIIGYSLIGEAKEYLVYIPVDETMKEAVFYILIAAMPLGTVLMSYIGALFLAEKLRLLNYAGKMKFILVRKYKKFGSFQYISQKATYIGISYLIFMKLIGHNNLLFKFNYMRILLITARYLIIYFLVKDAYTIICGFIYKISRSRMMVALGQVTVLYALVSYFLITTSVIVIISLLIDKKYSIKKNTDKLLDNINFKVELY